jgi:colicin import membrane protein
MSGRPEYHGYGGPPLNRMILVSVGLHVVILSLLILSPSFPSPKLTFGPVYTVSLVSTPGNVLAQKSSPALAKELMTADHPEPVLKKQLAPQTEVPIRTIETRKKQDPGLEKAMAEIRKKAAAEPVVRPPVKAVPEKPAAVPETPAAATAPAAAPAARPGDAALSEKMRAYYGTIWSRIKGGWALPQGILPGEVLEVVIQATIMRSGAITEVNYEKRSGNRFFDESALKAVKKASPLPPLPAGVGDSSIDIGIRFHHPEPRS